MCVYLVCDIDKDDSLCVYPLTQVNLPFLAQSVVLGAFYWGYLCAPFLGHYLSDRYGGETVQWVAAVVWSLWMLFTVQLAPYSHLLVVVIRFLSGLLQGE